MRKIYPGYLAFCAAGLFLIMLISSCSKGGGSGNNPTPTVKPFATLGLYEVDSGIYKRVFIPISGVGTSTSTTYYLVFDTGSAGMTIDATGLIPASMITSSGITVPGDSAVVNGITITNKTAVVSYGDAQSEISEYGNLAYSTVIIGDANGKITTKRIPIFLYYKIMDVGSNTQQPAHSNDVFGVGPGYSFANNAIGSPLRYFASANGVLSGFKLAKFSAAAYTTNGTYVNDLLTIGLVPEDVNPNSGFVMHQLTYYSQGGYSPDIAATVKYNNTTVNATILFDTGTPAISTIENSGASSNLASLPANTPITLTTSSGFTYSYTTSSADNITQVAKPSYTGDPRTIFSINFFNDNQFLMDYTGHEIGLKNN
jgi:hypothetical protein